MLAHALTAAYDVEALRADQFPITREAVYLNNAGISPLRRRTAEIMRDISDRLMLNPGAAFGWFISRDQAFRDGLRRLVNAESMDEIAGVQSTSMGVNMLAHGVRWERGQNVVLADVEFPSNAYPWMRAAEHYGFQVRLAPARDGGLTVDAVREAADNNTRLVAASQVQFLSGHRTDLEAIGAFCRERGILLAVDAIQAAGHLPLDVQKMNIAMLAAGGHKSLMGPPGQGFVYVRNDVANEMRQTFVGANATNDWFHWLKYDLSPLPGAARFGMGTPNAVGIVGLAESVTMLRELGVAAIDAYTTALSTYAIDRLREAGYPVVTPDAHGPIVTFVAADTDETTDGILQRLAERNVFVAKHWDAAKKAYMRVSVHCYNTPADIDRFMTALKESI